MIMKIIGRRDLRLCSSCASSYSFSAHKWVLSEVDNIVPKSNIWRSGRSFSSSIPSRVIEPQKSYKRVSKDVRQTMVEAFVKEYQSLNAGKFPTASQSKKQVGGSYYVLRSILQELKVKSRAFLPKNRDEDAQEKKLYEESDSLILTIDESSSIMSVKEDTETTSIVETIKDTESGVNGDENLKDYSLSQNSTQVEKTLLAVQPIPQVIDSNITSHGRMRKRKNKKASTPGKLNDDTTVDISLDDDVDLAATSGPPQEKKKPPHLCSKIIEDDKIIEPDVDLAGTSGQPREKKKLSRLRSKIVQDDKTTEPVVNLSATRSHPREKNKLSHLPSKITEDDKTTEPGKVSTNFELIKDENRQPEVSLDAAEFPRSRETSMEKSTDSKKSTLWGNLKSFADGIIDLWRKR